MMLASYIYYCTFIKTKKSTLVHYCYFILIQSRIPHCIWLCLLSPLEAVRIGNFSVFPCFFVLFEMSLIVLRDTGQVFCKMSHSLGLPHVFLMLRQGLWVWGKNATNLDWILDHTDTPKFHKGHYSNNWKTIWAAC